MANAEFNNIQEWDLNKILQRLNKIYDDEEKLLKAFEKLYQMYSQIQEDKELVQTFYMYKYNRQEREAHKWQG